MGAVRNLDKMPQGSEGRMDVLLFEASYGEGHRRAAQAVERAMRELCPELEIVRRDFFEMVSPLINRWTRTAYVVAVRYAPLIWHAFYRATERISPRSPLQRIINRYGRHELEDFLAAAMPRLIVHTFPTPAGIVSDLRVEGRLQVANAVVITDHAVHSQWIHPSVDRYYVGAEEVRDGMVARGVPADKVVVSGIPILPGFGQSHDVAAIRRELGVHKPFVVLCMAGAYGLIGGFDRVLRQIAQTPLDASLVVVTGHDTALRQALAEVYVHKDNEFIMLGYREDMDRLMAASSVLVSKAGGLTTSEAMASGLPMIIFRPIPGQEEENVKLVVGRGAGVLARTPAELVRHLGELRRDPQRLLEMRAKAKALGRPKAAETIARDLVATFW